MPVRHMISLGLLAAAIISLCALTARAQGALLAGAAKARITPATPQWIAGHGKNRRSIGAHDDLWARALVLKRGDQWLALASVDLLGFPYPYLQRVREMVKAVPAQAILVSATHTHSAPDVIGLWGPGDGRSGVDPAYVEFATRIIAEVITQAAAGMVPASIKYARGDLPGVSQNYRPVQILDPGLAALEAVGKDGKVIATLINFACHPEIMDNNYLTADFPNWLYQRVESRNGGIALFVNGAQGGMITANIEGIYSKGENNWNDAERIGDAIADKAIELLAAASAIADPDLVLRTSPAAFPVPEEKAEALAALGAAYVLSDGKRTNEVAAGAIGAAEFVTIPGEAFPNIGLLLKRWMTGDVKFIFGLTQDEMGYIMSREDYGLPVYEYETSMAVGPEVGLVLVEALRPLIEQVNLQLRGAAGVNAPKND